MKNIIAIVLFQSLFAVLARADVEDAELRHILERAVRYEDNPHAAVSEIRYAIQVAGGNTNRVVSLMKQMIVEGTEDDVTSFYILEIGKYGTSSDLPFLYQRVASSNLCEHATAAVLSIEGLTTNSLTQITSLLPEGRWGAWPSMCSRGRLLMAARKLPVGSPLRALTVSNAVQHAFHETAYPSSFDKSLRLTDPTYAISKRRLAALRSVQSLGVGAFQTNFVAQAIRELEAYPEANLPE